MSREYRLPTHFATGAVGRPGQRVFYLQAGDEDDIISVKMEKQQVQALAQFLASVLDDLPSPTEPLPPADLIEPVEPDFVIGQIAVGVDEAEGRIVLVLEEFATDEDDAEELTDIDPLDPEVAGSSARVHISSAQAQAFIAQSEELMNRGRPPCPLCGQPEDPTGHACPRLN